MGLFKSAIEKVKASLAKTRSSFSSELRSILHGKQLNTNLLDQIEQILIRSDVGIKTAIELRKDIEAAWQRSEITVGQEAIEYLKQLLSAYWPEEDRQLHFAQAGQGPTVILVTGINGAGKTTSIAKLAKHLRDDGKSVILAACDTFRAAAVQQLEVWSQRLDIDVIKGKQGGKPSAVAWDAVDAAINRNADVLIVDTAGRMHTEQNLMQELGKIGDIIAKKIPGAPQEVLLVLDATVGQNAVNQARIFTKSTAVTGIFLAKLDGTAKGGIVVAIREQLNIPVKFIGVGETPDDIEPFEPQRFVEAMFSE